MKLGYPKWESKTYPSKNLDSFKRVNSPNIDFSIHRDLGIEDLTTCHYNTDYTTRKHFIKFRSSFYLKKKKTKTKIPIRHVADNRYLLG